ncbi:GrpB family protein [Gracilibacillus sp. HCP3S3_G5_1]|uniref:GrpB family protein n=1 Tax=unclassified Gracilibacillus TaxID=2625209 RepID=UPI003F8B114B
MEIDEEISISNFNPEWKNWYEEEIRSLKLIFDINVTFEHIGSTSVPGLPSKPIVDILVGIPNSLEITLAQKKELEQIGYECLGTAGVPGRIYCRKRGIRSFNLAITRYRSNIWNDNILLRNYLRTHPDDANRYAKHKLEAYQQGYRKLLAYSDYKSDFVVQLIKRAKKDMQS